MAAIAIYSLKGGVGKTTMAVNLAWCSAMRSSRRTLLWDLDPQAASTYLLPTGKGVKDGAQAIFAKDIDAAKAIRPTGIARLDLIAADASLRGLDQLFHDLAKKKRLAKLLGTVADGYDRVILDCPPGLTETAEQVIRAADLIVVPVVPSPLSARAFADLAAHLDRKGPAVPLLPVHVMVDRRRKLHAQAIAENPGWPVIPMASIVEAMSVRRAPVGQFAASTAPAKAFDGLWSAIERQLAR
ncbi:ParA family protein [Sphingomonas japonica]|uniref:Cellulose biosynthesis protein BcsQ n=1 Tax=Sphingomonas japonica TaxID=511662 RepID=A0ABX0U5A1_9SPHN|nr:ParA family protein [Sphingomonas japonica]NIJ24432.1 cellulose biosynthesis protein BcsQ [Sphingomonas japonica]